MIRLRAGKPTCPRCSRYHSGLCGIPPGLTRGFGARRPLSKGAFDVKPTSRVSSPTPGGQVLQHLLAWGEKELAKVKDMLTLVPPDMEEHGVLLDRLGKLEVSLSGLKMQIALKGD